MANILLAEDDYSMSSFLTVALTKAGHNVVSCSDGLKAFDKLLEKKSSFELLLTDIVMPGMDGIELSQKAIELSPNIKVMFITGFAAAAVGHKDFDESKTKMLSKPFHLNDLVQQVDALLAA
ncbi:MAG: response regulator [Micavibrio sp.]|nr:response regulator [Micavibrio sp.]